MVKFPLQVIRTPSSSSVTALLESFGDGFPGEPLLDQDHAQASSTRSSEQRFQNARDVYRIKQVLDLLERWKLGRLDPLMYRGLMRLCARSHSLSEGQRIHNHLAARGLAGDRFLASELVLMYGRCGSVDLAKSAFAAIGQPDAWSRNCLLAALTRNGHLHPAIDLFESFEDRNIVSWNTMLQGFVRLGFFQEARDLFLAMVERNAVSWTIMLTAYARNRQLDRAMDFLAVMPERNTVSWNIVIAAAGRGESIDLAGAFFRMMLLDGILPSIGTFVTVFESIRSVELGREIQGLVVESGLGINLLVANAVLRFYVKCHCLEDCERTLQSMESRDTVTWSAMIEAYSCCGYLGKAVEIFDTMVFRDEIAVNSMMVAYARNGYVDRARNLFENLPEKDLQACGELIKAYGRAGDVIAAEVLFDSLQEIDESSWNSMVFAYARSGHIDRANPLLARMAIEGFHPSEEALAAVFRSCALTPTGFDRGRVLYRELIWNDQCLRFSALVQAEAMAMFSAQGSLAETSLALAKITAPSTASWNAAISRYSGERRRDDAEKLFYLMNREGFFPDYETFLALLSGRNIEECGGIFSFMVESFQIQPKLEHYTRLVESVAGRDLDNGHLGFRVPNPVYKKILDI